MNKQIKALAVVILVCYTALFVKLNQVQVLDADRVQRAAREHAVAAA